MVVAESCLWYWGVYAEVEGLTECVCGGGGGEVVVAELKFSVSSRNVGRPVVVGRPMMVGRPVAGGRPVPGRFRARDEQLGFEVEMAKMVKSGGFCGWKGWK